MSAACFLFCIAVSGRIDSTTMVRSGHWREGPALEQLAPVSINEHYLGHWLHRASLPSSLPELWLCVDSGVMLVLGWYRLR